MKDLSIPKGQELIINLIPGFVQKVQRYSEQADPTEIRHFIR